MAPGVGFEPTHLPVNSRLPYQLGHPGIHSIKLLMVGILGIEPSLTGSEPVVRPITLYPCNLWKGYLVLPQGFEVQSLTSYY